MAIQITQRMQNIIASFETYVSTNLVAADSVKVMFPEVPFESKSLQSWVELSYMKLGTQTRYRKTCAATRGREAIWMVQVSCYARKITLATGAPVNKFALMALRDKVCGRFPLGQEIDIKNHYASGTTVVDTMQIQEVSEATFTPPAGGATSKSARNLTGWVYTIYLRYTEDHGAS